MLGRVLGFGLLAAVTFVTGCTDAGPTSPDAALPPEASTSSHAAAVRRPWEAVSAGESGFVGMCAEGTGLLVQVSGSGYGTHVGRFAVELTGCLDVRTGGSIGLPSGKVTAANGDEIHITMTGSYFDGATGESVSVYEVNGGTGRFVDASGEFTNRGTTDYVTGAWSNRSTGWIAYGS